MERRIAARSLRVFCGLWFAFALSLGHAQRLNSHHIPNIQNGRVLWADGCAECHGARGKGAPQSSTEFQRPGTFPDFTTCDQTTPEPNAEWQDTILHGGKARGVSAIMPAFGQLLSSDQVDDLIAYMREMCTTPGWPRGELNLPRALVTEKAFPEKEFVLSTAANASGAPGWITILSTNKRLASVTSSRSTHPGTCKARTTPTTAMSETLPLA